MKDDGTGNALVDSGDTSHNDTAPTWSGDGDRIYFTSNEGSGIWYYDSSNGFTSGSPTRSSSALSGSATPGYSGQDIESYVRTSADGSLLTYAAPDGSGCPQIWTLSSSGGTATKITNTGCSYSNYAPTFAPSAYPSAPAPSWWSGTTCDTAHNSGSAPLTNGGVTTSFYGVTACGGGTTDTATTFGAGGSTELEWECTELVKRYMYLRWGVIPYSADGYQIVSNYSGSIMTKITNTGSNLPVVGDVISFNRVSPYSTTAGHTAIVTAVSVSGGSGTITIMEQNRSATGINTVTVSGGGISTTAVNGWLHHS